MDQQESEVIAEISSSRLGSANVDMRRKSLIILMCQQLNIIIHKQFQMIYPFMQQTHLKNKILIIFRYFKLEKDKLDPKNLVPTKDKYEEKVPPCYTIVFNPGNS